MTCTDLYTNPKTTNNMSITVLGSRGSTPVSSPEMAGYGGNTSCYLIETDNEAIIIDAGTGVMSLPDIGDRRISLLITHAHIDHILGFPILLSALKGKEISIYGVTRDDLAVKQQLERYVSTPLWPVTIDKYGTNIEFHEIAEADTFAIGEVIIKTMPSNHPGGATIYKLINNGVSVTVATDFEHETADSDQSPLYSLADFAAGSRMILYDAQYTPEEYKKCRGYGHSTYEKALELQKIINANNILLVHHAPDHTDEFLGSLQRKINSLELGSQIIFASEGCTFLL